MNSSISTSESDSLDTQPSHDTVADVEPVLHVLHTRSESKKFQILKEEGQLTALVGIPTAAA
jgi:hypothetical protein